MSQEQPKKYTKNEIIEIRERVEVLGDSKVDLAEKDNEFRKKLDDFRKKLNSRKIVDELANELAEMYSDETLEKMEAQERATKAQEETIKAQKEKLIDGLTGLRKKEALKAEIPRILAQGKRNKGKCCLLMIDVDEFKMINDTHGHLAGDQALKKVADVLIKSSRETDIVYRYAGDEFTILLINSDIKGAEAMIGRIKNNLDKVNEESEFNITLSIGISSVDYSNEDEDKDKDKLIKEADVAMYNVKKLGKNGSLEYKEGMKVESN
jgi:diguanylate cyclase (GGDEF)-like protein